MAEHTLCHRFLLAPRQLLGPQPPRRPPFTATRPPFSAAPFRCPDLLFYTVPFRCPGRAHACRLPPMPRPTAISSAYPVSRPTASYNRPTGLFRAGRAAKNETDRNRVATPNLPIALKCMSSWIQAIVSIAPQFSYPPHTPCAPAISTVQRCAINVAPINAHE